jgi:NSS family neurotransmitter:Na+ symporter
MAAAGGAHWSSRFAFIMASVGFAVGLGNIWRFPYVTGENGGAAFVLVYLACAFGIGVPILMSELLIGRRGQGSPPSAMANVAAANGRSRHWQWVGGMGLLAAYTIEIVPLLKRNLPRCLTVISACCCGPWWVWRSPG